ncbi:hypothetical protein M426DRAFT_238257 [Hypoxylon sp. CI-4A]|nr:hypothetical protein M426DRAFT_238257 [Hypoxylon sp. CI-4A]
MVKRRIRHPDDKEQGSLKRTTKLEEPLSIFDELAGYEQYDIRVTHPLAATYYARRAVLARTARLVDDTLTETIALASRVASDAQSIRHFSLEAIDMNSWSGKWKGEFFTDMWQLREDLQRMQYRFDQNLKVIERIELLEHKREDKKENDVPNNAHDMWEWENLQEMQKYAFEILDGTTKTYIEAIQATSAQFSNDQAASARRITGFASIFVPASLCAAVLAIPSFTGASDTEKFWIFWAVSVPLGIMAWIWFLSGLREFVQQTMQDLERLSSSRDKRAYLRALFGELSKRNIKGIFRLPWSKAHGHQIANTPEESVAPIALVNKRLKIPFDTAIPDFEKQREGARQPTQLNQHEQVNRWFNQLIH